MSADILFRRPFDPAARDIVFGQQEGAAQEDASGRLFVTLPQAGGISVAGRLQYDNAVSRSDVIGADSGWSLAVSVSPASVTATHAKAEPVQKTCRSAWALAAPLVAASRPAWRVGERLRVSSRIRWGRGDAIAYRAAAARWQVAGPLPHLHRSLSGLAVPAMSAAGSHWQAANIIPATPRRIRSSAASPLLHLVAASAGPAAPVAIMLRRIRWGWAEPLPPGRSVIIVTPPPEPWRCYTPPAGGAAHLLFGREIPRTADILFRCRGGVAGAIVIPIRSTYIVINDVTLIRLPDQTPLEAYGLSLKWDVDSWSVGWSASLPASALDAVMPDSVGAPVELLATINGTAVRVLAESISRDRRFSDARINVGGRGRVAWLADPYDPIAARGNASAATAQQLAAQALEQNGVPIGWSLDWQIPDWLVPAGVWSHQGSRIDAVRRIAEAAGGYVLGHRTDQTLHIRPAYPVLPWAWSSATPDIVIPSAVAVTDGITWAESPAYNRVYVSGEEGGILGQITRGGSAGDLLAPMVTDPLITAEAAARARGASILAAGGRRATVTLRMPVLPTGGGILDLGQLVEYQDHGTNRRGLVRAVSIEAALPAVWQNVEIETHA